MIAGRKVLMLRRLVSFVVLSLIASAILWFLTHQ